MDSAATPQPASATAVAKDDEQPDADALVPFVRNARDKWQVSVSFDDYWFNAPISEGGHGTQTGNLYGETLSIAPPVWHGDTSLEVSYRQGLLNGAVGYPNALYSSMETFVQEAFIGFRFRSLPWMHDGKERGHVIGYVGVSWDGWDTTETLIDRRKWPATGKPALTTDWNMFMANLGLGYDLTLWNPTTKWMSYRLGVRAEAIGALGGSSWDQKGNDSSDTLAVYGLARGTLYMDLILYNTIAIFVEGGYQESWWRFWEDPPAGLGVNNFEGYWGAFGRAGLAVQF